MGAQGTHHFRAAVFGPGQEELPSSGSTLLPQPDHAYLAAWGAATHGGIAAADPKGVWVLDGWFANANGAPLAAGAKVSVPSCRRPSPYFVWIITNGI